MSVKTSPTADASTSNANWGTLVIVLLVVIVGVVVGVVTLRPHAETNPVLVNPTPVAAPPAGPVPTASPNAAGTGNP